MLWRLLLHYGIHRLETYHSRQSIQFRSGFMLSKRINEMWSQYFCHDRSEKTVFANTYSWMYCDNATSTRRTCCGNLFIHERSELPKCQHSLPFLQVILMVFASAGGILAIIQLLTIVLGCCFASALAKEEQEYEYEDEIQYNLNYTQSRPGTPRGSRKNESTF